MKNLFRGLCALVLALTLVVGASAEEKPVKKPETKPAVKEDPAKKPAVKEDPAKKPAVKEQPKPAGNPLFTFPKNVKPAPTDEQVKQLEALAKEYTSRIAEANKEAQKKRAAIVTPERLKAQKEAVDKAKADGKKGGELNKIGQEALKLTKEEQDQLKAIAAELNKLTGEINKKKMDLLTAEQKASLKPQPKKPEPKKPETKTETKKPETKTETKKPEEKKPEEKKPEEKKPEEKKPEPKKGDK